jgi:GGDEF domain-containing protein
MVAGVLFLGAAVAGLPAVVLLDNPRIDSSAYLIVAASAVSGLVCMVAPWERLHRRWMNVLPPVAISQIVLSVIAAGQHGEVFRWFFVLSAIFIAYAFRRRGEVICHLGLLSAGMLGTSAVGSAQDQDALAGAIVGMPTIWLAAGVVVWLRENLERRERTDVLTGLSNRRALIEALNAVDRPTTLALFDLDGFKRYNDRLGHQAGDELLVRLAGRLQRAVAGHGTAYRLGGDELCVLVDDPALLDACDAALREGEIGASYGAARLPDEAPTPNAALRLVDTRMYAAKRASRDLPFLLDVATESQTPLASLICQATPHHSAN